MYYDYDQSKDLMISDDQYTYLGNYSSSVTYVYKNVVTYLGKLYISLVANTGVTPSSSSALWSFLTPLDSCVPGGITATDTPSDTAVQAYYIAIAGTRGEGKRSCETALIESGTIKFNSLGPRFQIVDTYNGDFSVSVINAEECREIIGVIQNSGSVPSLLAWGNYTFAGTTIGTLVPDQTLIANIYTLGSNDSSVLIAML